MSRPWVKLSTAIYRHPELGLVSDSAWRRFVECITLAGDVDDDGRLGTWAGVARQLYVSEDQLRSDVAELDGRIGERDGQLFVRDWPDHQPPSRTPEPRAQVTARKRSQRGHADVTQTSRKRDTHTSRSGHAPLEVEVEEETEGEEELPDTRVPRGTRTPSGSREERRNNPADKSAWDPVEQAISESYGGRRTRAKGGKLLAPVGELIGLLGRHAHDDPVEAERLWRAYWAQLDQRYAPAMHAAADKVGAWLASRNGHSDAVVRF